MRPRSLPSACLFMIFILCGQTEALAHTRSQSFSQWHAETRGLNFIFSVDQRRITQLARLYDSTDFGDLLKQHLTETLNVSQNGTPCALSGPAVRRHEKTGYYRADGNFSCPELIGAAPPRIEVSSFTAVSPSHIHLARVTVGTQSQEIVLSNARQNFDFKTKTFIDSLGDFVHLGFAHVVSGLDHMVFLLALALFAARPRMAVLCITGFTLGHSLTLALAFLETISPHEKLIEALIGLTIALTALDVAAKSATGRPIPPFAAGLGVVSVCGLAVVLGRMPVATGLLFTLSLSLFAVQHVRQDKALDGKVFPLLTVAFGLVHGAGFAGGLQHIHLDRNDILTPLIGFNLGVELAQLFALALVYVLLSRLGKYVSRTQVEKLASPVLFGMGLFWFAERLLA